MSAAAEPATSLLKSDRPVPSRWTERAFEWACACSTWFGLGVLVVLLLGVLWKGGGWLSWHFLTSYDSRHPEQAGVLAGLWGSFWLVSLATLVAVPVGVGAALFLEEYGKKGWLRTLIEINLSNLAGVPSIVYGILGMAVFVKMFGAFRNHPKILEVWLPFTHLQIPLPLGRTVLAGALTLALLILPIVIVASREALRAVPPSIRHASYALGATPLANGAAPGPAGGHSGNLHGRHPGCVAGDWRDGPAVDGRGRGLRGGDSRGDRVAGRRPPQAGQRARGSVRPLHGVADPDFQLGFAARGSVSTCRGGRDSCPLGVAPGVQHRGQRGPRPHADAGHAGRKKPVGLCSTHFRPSFATGWRQDRCPRRIPTRAGSPSSRSRTSASITAAARRSSM